MIDLAALRRAAGLTQTELAVALGVGQAQVSKTERQKDMLISTLASYLAAVGVEAKLVVQMGDQAATYDLTAGRGDRRLPRPKSPRGTTAAQFGSSGAS